jgi:hypothetical protein
VATLTPLKRLCTATAFMVLAAPLSAAEGQDPNWSLLETYCSDCHNATDWAGGVAFDTMTPDDVGTDAAVWEQAVRKLRGNLMPPPGKPQPPRDEAQRFVKWMEGKLDHAASTRPNAGHVVLHRLNRTEYATSIKAMLAVDVDAKTLLPPDTESGGFDNVAEVLSVSPSFLEQYISAARRLSALAVGEAAPKPLRAVYRAPTKVNRNGHVDGLPLGTRGGMVVDHYFPADGVYELNLYLDSVDSNLLRSYWLEYPNTLIVTLNGNKVFEQSLGGEADQRAVDKELMPAARKIQDRFRKIRLKVPAGTHSIGVTFLGRSLAQSDSNLKPLVAGEGVDRLPVLADMELIGPFDVAGVGNTASRAKIFVCQPANESEEQPCARRILGTLAREAFRRPVTEADMQAPMRFYGEGRAAGGFDAGIQKGLMAILASPKFLYRAELAPADAQSGTARRVSDLDLASRLSFFLWSQGPDEQLMELAVQGRLSDPAVLDAQTRRMLADPRSKSMVTSWAFKWLHVSALDTVDPDPRLYPEFDADLRDAFREELELFVDSVLREDRSVLQLLSAEHTFVNERLARHYGIANVRGDRFRRVTLGDSRRWGLIGKGAILMGTSYPDRTSPVLRGAWLLENVIGTPPAAPPPGVETALAQSAPGMPSLTVRERLQAHREVPSCNQCHGVIDPLGLALENFDATGAWVEKDRFAGTRIDASGELAGGGGAVKGPDDLRRALLARPDQFVQTLTERLMTFALGRKIEPFDMPVIRAIVRDTAAQDYRFESIVLALVKSAPFQMTQAPAQGVSQSDSKRTARVHH